MSRKFICIISIAFLPLLGYAQSNVDIDFDDNGVVDLQDLLALTEAFGSNQARYDLHPDGVIDIKDLSFLPVLITREIPLPYRLPRKSRCEKRLLRSNFLSF